MSSMLAGRRRSSLSAVIMLPEPPWVKSSSSSAPSTLCDTTCARATPARTASTAWVRYRRVSAVRFLPCASSSSASCADSSGIRRPRASSTGASLRNTSLAARSALAIATATSSIDRLNTSPVGE